MFIGSNTRSQVHISRAHTHTSIPQNLIIPRDDNWNRIQLHKHINCCLIGFLIMCRYSFFFLFSFSMQLLSGGGQTTTATTANAQSPVPTNPIGPVSMRAHSLRTHCRRCPPLLARTLTQQCLCQTNWRKLDLLNWIRVFFACVIQGASGTVGVTNAPSISPGCGSATGVQSGTISPGEQSQTSNAAAPPIQSSCKLNLFLSISASHTLALSLTFQKNAKICRHTKFSLA